MGGQKITKNMMVQENNYIGIGSFETNKRIQDRA
jgi:hypothetical protein